MVGLVVHRLGPLVRLMFGLKAMAAVVWSNSVIAAAGGFGWVFSLKFGFLDRAVLTHFGR